MEWKIRLFEEGDMDAIVDLSLAAWELVFESFAKVLGPKIFPIIYPDWRFGQTEVVTTFCMDREKYFTWVAEIDNAVVGFINFELNSETQTGEVMLLAVLPDDQNRGIGTALNDFALAKMVESGMKMAVVGTGGEEGHAPARRSYEKAGYTPLPLVRYYKALTTNQIELRQVIDADLPVFFENQRDPEACKMAAFTAKDPEDRAAFDAHWTKIRAHGGVTIRTILYDGEVVGSVLVHNWFDDLDVSYWLGQKFWGKGIATKALNAFLEEIPIRPLYGRAAADNQASIRVLEKCGFEVCGQDRGFANARGEEIDEVVMVLK